MSERIAALLQRCTFPVAGTSVTLGVSGGADSMAMLVLAIEARCEVHVVHVDHGLRSSGGAEAALVVATAQRLGATVRVERAAVDDGPNLEARARDVRHRLLGPDALLGHTLDDQAETVLWFLMRGTGPAGIAGIDPERRPILGLRRGETEAVCRDAGVEFVLDPSNSDPRFTRNRIRHELLPLLDDIAQRDVAPLIAGAATRQRAWLDAVGPLGSELDPTDARALADAPRLDAIEALRRWWLAETQLGYVPDAAATERMYEVATGEVPRHDIVAGWSLHRRAQRLRFEAPVER